MTETDLTERFLAFALLGVNWVLWLLVLLSVGSIAVMFERAWFLRRQRGDWQGLARDVRHLLDNGDLPAAVARTQTEPSCVAAVIAAGLRRFPEGPESVGQAMEGAKALARIQLERNLAVLGTLGANAPFIGLFGTVLGVIDAFHKLSQAQTRGTLAVMGSLSEALVATAVGLLVAIPAVVAFNYFQRRVRAVLLEADALSHGLMADSLALHGAPLQPIAEASVAGMDRR